MLISCMCTMIDDVEHKSGPARTLQQNINLGYIFFCTYTLFPGYKTTQVRIGNSFTTTNYYGRSNALNNGNKAVVWFKLELIELLGCVLPEHELVWVRRMQFILIRGKSVLCNILLCSACSVEFSICQYRFPQTLHAYLFFSNIVKYLLNSRAV